MEAIAVEVEGDRDGHRVAILARYEVPADLRQLSSWLQAYLAKAPADRRLVVFLDAVDQLSPADNARTLHWLPRKLPPHVKLVLSAVDEEGSAGECMRAAGQVLPPEMLAPLGPLGIEDGAALLTAWLDEAGRRLQSDQRRAVLEAFAGCPLPLFLRLMFEEARRWASYDPVVPFRPDVAGLVEQMCERLESAAEHGPLLVSRGLGYLAAARQGLTEDEIIDVISSDETYFADFRKRIHHLPAQQRLPPVVWSRLHLDLAPFLTERRADNTVLLSFYHRQVGEVVARRYLSEQDRVRAHTNLAAYTASGS